jgi:hypothetical protein
VAIPQACEWHVSCTTFALSVSRLNHKLNMRLRVINGRLVKKIQRIAFVLLLAPLGAFAAAEQTLNVLKIGAETYQNVTILTKAKDYIFITHSTGMSNIKVSDLSEDLRDKLGYAAPARESTAAKGAVTGWAKNTLAKVDVKQFSETLRSASTPGGVRAAMNSKQLLSAVGVLAISYLLFCYCSMLICQKTGTEAGVLVWVPVLQLFPLLRAAGMSRGWFVAFLLPLVNIVGLIVWATNIAQARGKSGWTALFLILPVTNLLAFLYLAFSGIPKREERRVEITALEFA